ncbi:MAG: acyl-CoA dehydrogenase family protein, partial [Actinomycetota bacterium]
MSAPTVAEFRSEVETFFDRTLPDTLDGVHGQMARAKAWRAALFDAGLAAIDYPVEVGGRGLGPDHVAGYREVSRGRVPREDAVFGIGVGMAMPTLRWWRAQSAKRRERRDPR